MTKFTPRQAKLCVDTLALMPYFPADQGTRSALVQQLAKMVTYNEEAEWLAYRATQVFQAWPGIREIRALFCKRFRPKDGVDATSLLYPDGFSSEAQLGPVPVAGLLPAVTEREALAAASIPASHQIAGPSADPELATLVDDIASRVEMPAPRRPRTTAEIEEQLYKRKTAS